jgi:starch synthase (maltosyl-transferring)
MNQYSTFPAEGRRRTVIENVSPEIDGGNPSIKRTVNERVIVEADIFADGHDSLTAVLKYRQAQEREWLESPMEYLTNDRWRGYFVVTRTGDFIYTVEAWVNHFESWRKDLKKKLPTGQNIAVDIQVGSSLVESTARRLTGFDAERLWQLADDLRNGASSTGGSITERALDDSVAELMNRHADRSDATTHRELRVTVDRELARCGAWYELFPRSFGPEAGKHGTLRDLDPQLERLGRMGFDILYLPPVHPIGKSFRKGKNNQVTALPSDPGSPWAIGSPEGGHKAIHPELGTLMDFARLVTKAREYKIEIALDVAFQCSADHPYVRDHPEWFRHRPDGTIQYAENPPKVYQDIVPFDFECKNWRELWLELKSVFDFWIAQGVQIFRVDNPHTKSLPFWGWCIGELKEDNPNLIFLAEAFTRPKVMYELAKLGFSQSYNYFPWRNTKEELTGYFQELVREPVVEFFRPNIWPNTPDILPKFLQEGGPAAFAIRFVLAATLGPSYGIYGPAFEICEHVSREPGSEEYLNSEKYEIKHWDLAAARPLESLITRVNRIRHDEPALQASHHLGFPSVDNDQIIAYSKSTADGQDTILTIVNLNPYHTQSGWINLPLADLAIDPQSPYQMHDLLDDTRYQWQGERNYIELNPGKAPAHIFRLRRPVLTRDGSVNYL